LGVLYIWHPKVIWGPAVPRYQMVPGSKSGR